MPRLHQVTPSSFVVEPCMLSSRRGNSAMHAMTFITAWRWFYLWMRKPLKILIYSFPR
ncbi:MAG: hypothetical protein ACTSRA_02765 [Promethearchaeota archaeon]